MLEASLPGKSPEDRPWRQYYTDAQRNLAPSANDALSLFRAAVAASGDQVAIRYFDRTFTYGELDRLSDMLAAYWRRRGISRGDRVAIILQNIPQFPVATIAAWKAGAIPMPCNPMYTERELAGMFGDAAPLLILCETQNDAKTKAAAAAAGLDSALVMTVSPAAWQSRDDLRVLPHAEKQDGLSQVFAAADDGMPIPERAADPNDIGLLMYTSGTTGKPKGAMLTHANLAFNAETSRIWFNLPASCVALGMAPLFHITGFECNLCASFAVGGSLILNYRFHPDVVLDAIEEHRPNFAIGAITAFIALADNERATPSMFECLTRLYSGGAPISPVVAEAFRVRTGRALLPSYGMTEAAAPTHVAPLGQVVPVHQDSGVWSIGIPTSGVEVQIVDDEAQQVKPGEAGEMLLRGAQIMSGYWQNPGETEKTLVDGWMRTGDVAVMDQNGWFYLVDRKKDVIVASGFKVWPREVEEVLYAHPAVREAAVVGVADAYRGETVKAFVSLKPGATLDRSELIAFCRERLAAYKAPRIVEVCSELPKTASGKITRAALRERASRQED